MTFREPDMGLSAACEILVCETDSPHLLMVSPEGTPVWPVSTAEELNSLRALASVFGGVVTVCEGRPAVEGQSPASPRPETVAFLHRDCGPLARLYAHLTGRRHVQLSDAAELGDLENFAVLVTRFKGLTPDVLDVLERVTHHGRAPGIICADDESGLRKQVLLRSAALAFSVRRGRGEDQSPPWVDVFPLMPIRHYRVKSRRVVGALAAPEAVRGALGSDAGVLRVLTTSDGVDAPLGGGLIICPMDRPTPAADAERSPRCKVTGFCHRTHKPVSEAVASGPLVAPEAVRAKVMLWQTCLGVVAGSFTMDDMWGVGRRLVASDTIGALVTTCDYILTDITSTEDLTRSLAAGAPLGSAVAQRVTSTAPRQLRHRLFIFGDPALTLPPTAEEELPKLDFAKSKQERAGLASLQTEPRPTRETAVLLSAIEVCPPKDRVAEWQPALSAGREMLRSNEEREADGAARDDDRFDPEFSDIMLRYIIARRWARWIDDWLMQSAHIERAEEGIVCPTCATGAVSQRVSLVVPGAAVRRSSICRRCGPIEDAPFNSDVRLGVSDDGTCRLIGRLPTSDWLAYLAVYSDIPEETVLLRWPADDGGAPAREFSPQVEWPVGPLRMAFVMMSDSWHLFTQPFRWWGRAAGR